MCAPLRMFHDSIVFIGNREQWYSLQVHMRTWEFWSATDLDESPLIAFLLNLYRTLLVEADSAGVEDGGGKHGVADRGEALFVKVIGLEGSSVDMTSSVYELLDRDIAVSALAVKVPCLGWSVLI